MTADVTGRELERREVGVVVRQPQDVQWRRAAVPARRRVAVGAVMRQVMPLPAPPRVRVGRPRAALPELASGRSYVLAVVALAVAVLGNAGIERLVGM